MDAQIRDLQRLWRAQPEDQALLAKLLAARRRVGESCPPEELAAQQGSGVFCSDQPFEVFMEDEAGEISRVGVTPGRVEVPACRFWWVKHEDPLTEAVLAELGEARVPGLILRFERLEGERLAGLLSLNDLRTLVLQGCRNVDDACLQALQGLESLESLELIDMQTFGKEGLSALAGFPSLTDLKLERPLQLDANDLQALREVTRLSTLRLTEVQVPGEALAHLAPLANLRALSLIRCNKVSGKAFSDYLPKLPGLRRLDLVDCKSLADTGLAAVRQVTGLKELTLRLKKPCSAKALANLKGAEGLTTLRVKVKDGKAAGEVGQLGSLQSLDIEGHVSSGWDALSRGLQDLRELRAPFYSEEEVATLANLSQLESLKMRDFPSLDPLESEELLPLASLTGLRRLDLRGLAEANASTLACVARLARLESLRVSPVNDPPAPEDWEPLTRLEHLHDLHVECPPEALAALRPARISRLGLRWTAHDGHVEELTRWSELEALELPYDGLAWLEEHEDRGPSVSLKGLAQLKERLGELRELTLIGHDIGLRDLNALMPMKELRRITVEGSFKLSDDDLRRLAEDFPPCTFRRRMFRWRNWD